MSPIPGFIECRIIFKKSVPAFDNATIHVFLEDISHADAEAFVLAEKIIKGVQHNSSTTGNDGTVIGFNLTLEPGMDIDPRHDYAVRIWVDTDSNGNPDPKDLHSDQIFRVLTQGFGNRIEIIFTR